MALSNLVIKNLQKRITLKVIAEIFCEKGKPDGVFSARCLGNLWTIDLCKLLRLRLLVCLLITMIIMTKY